MANRAPSTSSPPAASGDADARQPLLGTARSRSPSPARSSAAVLKIRTPLERVLLGLAIGLFVSCGILLGLYVTSIHRGVRNWPPFRHSPGPGNAELCVSPECVLSSARIIGAMNASVDPCQDFYQYACGGWEHANDIPDSQSRISTFSHLFEQNKRVIRDILLSDSFPSSDLDTSTNYDQEKGLHLKARTLFASCLDEQKLASLKAKPLKALVDKFLKAIPTSNPAEIDRKVLADVLADQQAFGIDSIVDVGVGSDDRNPKVQVITVSQAGTYLPSKEYYLDSNIVEIYKRAIASTFKSLYSNDSLVFMEFARKDRRDPHIPDTPPRDPRDPNIPEQPFPNDPIIIPAVHSMQNYLHTHGRRKPHIPNPQDPRDPDIPEQPLPNDPIIPIRKRMRKYSNRHGYGHRKPHVPDMPPRDPRDPNVPEQPFPNDPIIVPNVLNTVRSAEPNWDAIAAAVVEFESKLAHEWMPNEDQGDPTKTYNPMTIHQLETQSRVVPWGYYLSRLARDNDVTNPIQPTDTVISLTPGYLNKVDAIVQSTPPNVLNTYFAWRTINAFMVATSDETRQVLDELRHAVHGIPPGSHTPREDYCIALTDRTLGAATGRWFVAKMFPRELRQSARDMIASILTAFDRRLDALNWLDPPTRDRAKQKAKALDRKIGCPSILNNVTAVVEEYKALHVDREDHFGNYVRSTQLRVRKQWNKLGKPTDYTEWGMTSATVNAYYNPSHNEIVFPAGILQPPFFSANVPAALNYGAIGVVAGHELGHAFDNNGRWYDEEGKLADWWGNQTAREFESRAKCFINQYGNFSIKNPRGDRVNVNGRLTLGENLADNGGVSQSWAAWKLKYGHVEEKVQLPGLEGVPSDQLFFLGFANVWCGRIRPEAAVSLIRTDPHSPAFVRVNAAVQNSKAFADAFQCGANTPMNPSSKCELW